MAYASKFPDRVQALVLIASGGVDMTYLDYYSPNIAARLTNEDSVKIREAESLRGIDRELSNLEEFRINLTSPNQFPV